MPKLTEKMYTNIRKLKKDIEKLVYNAVFELNLNK